MKRRLPLGPAWTALALLLVAPAARADLDAYFRKPEPAFRWEKVSETAVGKGTAYDLKLVSQTWQGDNWEHRLWYYRPAETRHPGTCALFNTGGSGDRASEMLFAMISDRAGVPFSILYNIPKQPLYGGLREDELIVYTWQKYIETGDESWPLHFPMAKAVLKAMDAIQAFSKEAKLPTPSGFVVSGASKRGWTTWLVGASKDARVKAIAPMVIDILNLPAQVKAQLDDYGAGGSEQIGDYASGGMLQILGTERGKRLIELEDPYSYRTRYTMPKLLLLGTNDRYWVQDALNLYWDGLPAPKYVAYIPNSGHGLEDRIRVAQTMSAFLGTVASGGKMPTISWAYSQGPDAKLTVTSTPAPRSARLFQASGDTRDLRGSKWTSNEVPVTGGTLTIPLPKVEKGYMATYAELTYPFGDGQYTLTTQLIVRKAGQ